MSNKSIYDILISAGMTKEGACAILGNMAAESLMKPTNAQDSFGVNDEAYTAEIDSGRRNFIDGIGYGLCQWTSGDRKANLLAFAKMKGTSVGDGDMQAEFCVAELATSYGELLDKLCHSHDLFQLTQAVCVEYERPAHNNVGTRYEYAQKAMDYFGEGMYEDGDIAAPDACPLDGPCEKEPDVSGAFALLAEYMQTEEFQRGYVAFVAGKVGAK